MAGAGEANQVSVDTGQLVHDAILAWLGGLGVDRKYAVTVAASSGAVVAVIASYVSVLFGAVFRIASGITTLFLQGIDDVRSNNQDALNTTLAAAASDILGVDVPVSSMPTKGGGKDNIAKATATGGALLDAVTGLMGGQVRSTPGHGEQAARGLLGFGVNFAVNAGLLSLIGEIESLGFIKAFKELPEEIQRTMGFGRLMRLAFQPVIHALITQPYTYEVNALYTPHRLSPAEYITALASGRMTADQVHTALAELGYSDGLQAELIFQHATKVHPHQIDALIRWGKITQDDGVNILVAQGMPAAAAQRELDALHLQQADAQERAYADEILKLAQNRQITPDVFSSLIQRLHMAPEEQQGLLNRLGVYLDTNTKRPNIGEVLYLMEHNLITTDAVEAWLTSEGYNQDAAALLELWLDQKVLDWQAVQKAKAAKAAAAAAKKAGKQPPPAT